MIFLLYCIEFDKLYVMKTEEIKVNDALMQVKKIEKQKSYVSPALERSFA